MSTSKEWVMDIVHTDSHDVNSHEFTQGEMNSHEFTSYVFLTTVRKSKRKKKEPKPLSLLTSSTIYLL